MPLTTSPQRADQALIGKALRAIREAKGMTQGDLGKKLQPAISSQAWQKYEAGERKFTRDRMQAILEILETTPEELADAKAQILDPDARPRQGVSERPQTPFLIDVYGRPSDGGARPLRSLDLRSVLGPGADAIEMADDTMVPWVEPGELVFYDRERYPKLGAGCVVETMAGDFYVKRYEKSDRSFYYFKELFPEERITPMPRGDVRGVYAIRLRGD